jgi:hypothetical protein
MARLAYQIKTLLFHSPLEVELMARDFFLYLIKRWCSLYLIRIANVCSSPYYCTRLLCARMMDEIDDGTQGIRRFELDVVRF